MDLNLKVNKFKQLDSTKINLKNINSRQGEIKHELLKNK